MPTRLSTQTLGILAVFFGLMATGCGSKSSVSGRVTLDGQPVESGFVTFFPVEDKGQSVGTDIVHGEYSIDVLTPGKKRVLVNLTTQTSPASTNATKTREEVNTERISKSKRKLTGKKTPGSGLVGNDKIIEVGSGSQRIDIPLEKSDSAK